MQLWCPSSMNNMAVSRTSTRYIFYLNRGIRYDLTVILPVTEIQMYCSHSHMGDSGAPYYPRYDKSIQLQTLRLLPTYVNRPPFYTINSLSTGYLKLFLRYLSFFLLKFKIFSILFIKSTDNSYLPFYWRMWIIAN